MSKLKPKQRTITQNRALHLYFKMLAETLNDAGLDMRVVLKPEIEIPWNGETVKEYLWRPVQKMQLKKQSTTELTTQDINTIYETLNRHLAKSWTHIPFPSIETQFEKLK